MGIRIALWNVFVFRAIGQDKRTCNGPITASNNGIPPQGLGITADTHCLWVYSLHKTRFYIPSQESTVQHIIIRWTRFAAKISNGLPPLSGVSLFSGGLCPFRLTPGRFPSRSQGISLLFRAIPGNSEVSAAGESTKRYRPPPQVVIPLMEQRKHDRRIPPATG